MTYWYMEDNAFDPNIPETKFSSGVQKMLRIGDLILMKTKHKKYLVKVLTDWYEDKGSICRDILVLSQHCPISDSMLANKSPELQIADESLEKMMKIWHDSL